MPNLAAKFRQTAATLAKQITAKRGARLDNTPKRAKQVASARIESDHLERIKDGLEAIATAIEAGTLPTALEAIKTKQQLADMLRTHLDCSGGYYSIRDTGDYADQSDLAVALRTWLHASKDAAKHEQAAALATKRAIDELEAKVRFQPIPGFFPTPPDVIERMLDIADIQQGHIVLEPSAGKGDIIDAILKRVPAASVRIRWCEINYQLRDILVIKGFDRGAPCHFMSNDFFDMITEAGFDRIIMNPPFEHGQDIAHIRHAYDCLVPGGRLVSVCSPSPFFSSQVKAVEFREWLKSAQGVWSPLPDGSFKTSFNPTGVSAVLVWVDKPRE